MLECLKADENVSLDVAVAAGSLLHESQGPRLGRGPVRHVSDPRPERVVKPSPFAHLGTHEPATEASPLTQADTLVGSADVSRFRAKSVDEGDFSGNQT